MNRSFLYAVIVFLSVALGLVYAQKTNPDFLANITGASKQADSWQKDDPGWNQGNTMPPQDMPAPVTPAPPSEQPKTEPTPPPQPQPPQQPPQQQPLQRRRMFPRSCPPNG